MGTFIDSGPSGRHPQYQDTSSPSPAPTNNQNGLDDPTNTIDNKLDELIDTALHPERNGLLVKEHVAEGASYEWLIKRELKAAINKTIMEAAKDEIKKLQFTIVEEVDKYLDTVGMNSEQIEWLDDAMERAYKKRNTALAKKYGRAYNGYN